MNEYVEYRESNGAVFLGEIVRREAGELLLLDARAPPGSRAMLWLPANRCTTAKAPNEPRKRPLPSRRTPHRNKEPNTEHETKRSISDGLFQSR